MKQINFIPLLLLALFLGACADPMSPKNLADKTCSCYEQNADLLIMKKKNGEDPRGVRAIDDICPENLEAVRKHLESLGKAEQDKFNKEMGEAMSAKCPEVIKKVQDNW